VLAIVDGDTLRVIYQQKKESIRVIGIDTPESKPNKKAVKDAYRAEMDREAITSYGSGLGIL